MNCRRTCDGTNYAVKDSCFQKYDYSGNEICYLNGCGDIVLKKMRVVYIIIIAGLIVLVLFGLVVTYLKVRIVIFLTLNLIPTLAG